MHVTVCTGDDDDDKLDETDARNAAAGRDDDRSGIEDDTGSDSESDAGKHAKNSKKLKASEGESLHDARCTCRLH